MIGVHQRKDTGKWMAAITHNGQRMYIGQYENSEDAAMAYNSRCKELRGDIAVLNDLSALTGEE